MQGFQVQFGWRDAAGNSTKAAHRVAEEAGWISALLTSGAAVGAAAVAVVAGWRNRAGAPHLVVVVEQVLEHRL